MLRRHFDAVALANNHSYDYGTGGLTGTIRLLDEAGLDHVGAGADAATARAPVVLSAGGIDMVFGAARGLVVAGAVVRRLRSRRGQRERQTV